MLTLGIFLLAGCSSGPAESKAGVGEFDAASLEEVEDLAESLANDLLALSVAVRDGDTETLATFFADTIEGPQLPSDLAPAHTVARWIDERHWELNGLEPSVQSRAEFLERLGVLTGRFTEIDDARFKVAGSDLKPGEGTANIKFFVVGRNQDGHRERLDGKAYISVQRADEGPWQFTHFESYKLGSKLSRTDLFSEVALTAGVAARFPPFGEGRNQGFVFHGVATADVNADGLLDIATSGVDSNRLYLNRGDGKFDDVSVESFVGLSPVGSGALFLDFDNDGDPDLFYAAVGTQILFENRFVPDGEVRFWDISEKAGVDRDAVGFSALAADINADSYPDIYVASYNRYGTVMPNSWIQATNGTPNLLLVNQGDGTFREEGVARGVADDRWTYAAGFFDIDEDGDQDLYVANDFGRNGMYRNDDGNFVDVAEEVGLVDPGFGMGVSFGDYDNDGDFDVHVTNMSSTAGQRILKRLYPEDHEIRINLSKQAVGNSLYRNDGDGTFEDVTADLGGLSGGWGFGGGFFDFDNDGREDIYSPNGFISGKSMKDT